MREGLKKEIDTMICRKIDSLRLDYYYSLQTRVNIIEQKLRCLDGNHASLVIKDGQAKCPICWEAVGKIVPIKTTK